MEPIKIKEPLYCFITRVNQMFCNILLCANLYVYIMFKAIQAVVGTHCGL